MRSNLCRRVRSYALGPYLVLGLGWGSSLACGDATDGLFNDEAAAPNFLEGSDPAAPTTLKAGSAGITFPGAGTSGAAQPLSAGLGPESSSSCDPAASQVATSVAAPVQHVCFYTEDDANTLAATIEQVVEVVGTEEWVHLRLTLSPDFVDNTYGETAIGWEDVDGPKPPGGRADATPAEPPRERPERGAAPLPREPKDDAPPPPRDAGPGGAPPPPAAGAPGDAPPPPAGPDGADAGAPPAPGPDGEALPGRQPGAGGSHTFRDLVGSDHAEIELLDAEGELVMEFWLDYLSASESAASGYAALGVSGGEGRISVGDPDWLLASTTSMDRNLNACGLSSFTTNSPETDADYTPNPAASDWDYRVSYEAWISAKAFGAAGFGSALIELVHASPSKHDGNSLNVVPAPCPADPANPEAVPEPVPPVLTDIR